MGAYATCGQTIDISQIDEWPKVTVSNLFSLIVIDLFCNILLRLYYMECYTFNSKEKRRKKKNIKGERLGLNKRIRKICSGLHERNGNIWAEVNQSLSRFDRVSKNNHVQCVESPEINESLLPNTFTIINIPIAGDVFIRLPKIYIACCRCLNTFSIHRKMSVTIFGGHKL